jgi:hypothetical protein
MTKPNFQQWFCLKSGRRNFQIDPVEDKAFLFGEPTWEEEINSRLKRAQLLGTPVRLIWWGQYGIGKTHRLRHTQFLVTQNAYKYFPCYVVASDIQEKTTFERLHFELVNALGRDEMRKHVSAYLLKLSNMTPGLPDLKEICGNVPDVESAMRSFGGNNDKLVMPAWRFLCGLELKGTELDLANVTKPCLDNSIEFAATLGAFAKIIHLQTEKELLFLIDEAENLIKVTNKTAESKWQETLRAVLDIRLLSLVVTVGAERQQDLPKLILQPDIVRRVERDNYVHMEAYKAPVASSFIKDLLDKLVDPAIRTALEGSEGLAAAYPDYDPALYPFTSGSFDKFCDWVVVDPRAAKPSEIIAKLNNVAAEAYFKDLRIITKDHLTNMGAA